MVTRKKSTVEAQEVVPAPIASQKMTASRRAAPKKTAAATPVEKPAPVKAAPVQVVEAPKKRSAEDRRQAILAEQAKLQEQMEKRMQRLQEQLARLERPRKPGVNPLEVERKALPRHVAKLLPTWPLAQVMGALAFAHDAVDNNPDLADDLQRRGDEFLQNQPRRGRPPKQISQQ